MREPARSAFIGETSSCGAASGFAYGHWTSDRWGDAVQPHGHDDAHLILVTAGAYETRADGEDPTGGTLVYNPPGLWHADRFVGGPGGFFTLTLSPDRLESLRPARLPSAPRRLNTHAWRGLSTRLMRAACAGGASSELERASLCLELVCAAAPPETRDTAPPSWLAMACDLLRERDPGDIDAVSRAVGVHAVHLARTFRRFLHCSPGDYRLGAQLHDAAHALARTRAGLAEIALDAGFADQSHFNRRFRAVFGVTPAQYRQRVSE